MTNRIYRFRLKSLLSNTETESNTNSEQTITEQTDMETTARRFVQSSISGDAKVTVFHCENVTGSAIDRRAVPTAERRTSAWVKLGQASRKTCSFSRARARASVMTPSGLRHAFAIPPSCQHSFERWTPKQPNKTVNQKQISVLHLIFLSHSFTVECCCVA